MEKNLGHATAYGYAKSKGYSGTEDEFAELMADYASVGQSAAQSAEQAAASATSASGSAATAASAAQTATSKASEAVTAAGTATTKASEASTSAYTASTAAQTATDKASEATTSATTATAKASEAGESATTATTAKTDAESARDAAAQSASEAAASAESIDPETLEHKAYGAYVVESESGAIASFADGADSIPMKDVLVHIEPVQEGSGDPSPENVRPISGWTGAKVTRTGKNLLPPYKNASKEDNGITFTNDNGRYTVNGTSTARASLDIDAYLPAGTYTLAGFESLSENMSVYIITADIKVLANITLRNNTVQTFTISEDASIVRFTVAGMVTINGTANLEIVSGSTTLTEWEPYSGDTYDITFPSEAGTVYGGTLDVTSGVLTVDKIGVDLTTGMSGGTAGSGYVFYKQLSNVKTVSNSRIADILNEAYTPIRFNAVSVESGTIALRDNQTLYVNTGSDSIYPVGKAILPLATPITYHLTPQEITSLLGTNNLWADTGDSDVEYRADTTLYISRLTEPDADMIADANIVSGQYFMVGNSLYRATSNIASGASVIIGTNAVKVSLATALNEINQ